jgi:hypothetical protein
MMKSDDKERVLPDDMIPTTKVYTTKVLKAAKKPWCASGLALCIAGVSIIMSISILIASMYWFGLVPDEIVKGDDQKWIKKIFGEVDDHEKRLTDLEIGQICELPMVLFLKLDNCKNKDVYPFSLYPRAIYYSLQQFVC